MVSTVLLSDVFLMVIFPLSGSTSSSNVKTILLFVATPVALSAGLEDDKVGLVLSTVVKLRAVVLDIPAYELLLPSSKAVASIKT